MFIKLQFSVRQVSECVLSKRHWLKIYNKVVLKLSTVSMMLSERSITGREFCFQAHSCSCWENSIPHPIGLSTGLSYNMVADFLKGKQSKRKCERLCLRQKSHLFISYSQKWHSSTSTTFYLIQVIQLTLHTRRTYTGYGY